MAGRRAIYTLKLKGEHGIYQLRGAEERTRQGMAETLGDLTGYRAAWVERHVLRPIKVGESSTWGDEFGIGIGSIKLIITRTQ